MATVLFAGGDRRTLAALHYIKEQGYTATAYALTDRIPTDGRTADALVLPFPCLKNGRLNAPLIQEPPTLTELIEETAIPINLSVIGGPLAENPFPHYTDLSLREDLKLRNAVTTTEGALDLLIRNTDRAILGLPCLVIGYGAIGKRLSAMLFALGANVTVAARKGKDRTSALLQGYAVQDTGDLFPGGYKAIFNTVPALLLTEEKLRQTDSDVRIFELASAPGGCDTAGALRLDRTIINGPALPGKVAPVTAGEDLAKTVIDILSKQEKGSGASLGT